MGDVPERMRDIWRAGREYFGHVYEEGPVSELLDAAQTARENARRAFRARVQRMIDRSRPWEFITAPVIFSLIIPFVFLDLCVTLFQTICFPVYRIPRVRRADYIRVDRHKLGYLNWLQKLNCAYCGYCNGVIAYVREVAGRTEHYWCPIKHASHTRAPHDHYDQFLPYGDSAAYEEGFWSTKDKVRACEDCTACAPQKPAE
ncbi:MAG: hypothetical protein ACRBBK_10500 [Paracoccaceae bacterium]